ncbi:MAG: MnhB domain-containing protein [Staphylothermus sp.]|nr:MnhB domain-containing protein [Staphylothermus sp.]
MKKSEICVIISIVIFIFSLAYITSLGGLGYLPPVDVRKLAQIYLASTYNPYQPTNTSSGYESVTAIIWDFRGLDTFFETAVFYGAIIASVAIYRGVEISSKKKSIGMSPIAKTVTRLSLILIPIVAASIAFHGHLTPGGGFQAGSVATVVIVLSIMVFGLRRLVQKGVTKPKILLLRSLGLIGIGLTAIGLVLAGLVIGVNAYIFQNQAKAMAEISYPMWIDDVLFGGSLLFFNIFEFVAVMAGFTLVLMLFSIEEEEVKKVIK